MHGNSLLLRSRAERNERDAVVGLGVGLGPDVDRAPGEAMDVFFEGECVRVGNAGGDGGGTVRVDIIHSSSSSSAVLECGRGGVSLLDAVARKFWSVGIADKTRMEASVRRVLRHYIRAP